MCNRPHSTAHLSWKGFPPGITAVRAIYTTALAKHGFTGPLRLFEGPNGLDRMFNQEIRIDWSNPSLEMIRQTVMKTPPTRAPSEASSSSP